MSRMLLPAMSILRIRRAGAMFLQAAASEAKAGRWLLAEMNAKTGIEIINAAGRLLNGNASGFAVLEQGHMTSRGVTRKRHLGREGRIVLAARALIDRELARAGRRTRSRHYYVGRDRVRSRRRR